MKRKILKASDGMILTDGKIFGTEIYLAKDADGEKFKEITMEEYNKLMEEVIKIYE